MIIHSKTTYKLEANAAKAGKHWERISQYIYIGTHKLPSGRFCYEFRGETSAEYFSKFST